MIYLRMMNDDWTICNSLYLENAFANFSRFIQPEAFISEIMEEENRMNCE